MGQQEAHDAAEVRVSPLRSPKLEGPDYPASLGSGWGFGDGSPAAAS